MVVLNNKLAAASMLALPALVAAGPMQLQTRQYQDPNSQLVLNEPSCDFYQCTIYWQPGSQVAVNWVNPPSGDVHIDLMTNNNADVAYSVATAPAVSTTCDAGAGFGQAGTNGATCGGFVFTVPSSWAAGNYTALRATSIQNPDLQSYTDKIYITQNSTTPTDAKFSVVSGSVEGSATATGGSSSAAASATTTTGAAAATSTTSHASSSVSKTASSTRSTSTTTSSSGSTNAAASTLAMGSSGALLLSGAAVFLGFAVLL
ncbi:hypothetical protein BCV70DRAFT_9113 [Testicularia cyperi]|uniref:Uncharacterized protein n=1 Tax=Testicularia cyperi TaxID=1882483 RepID=A0A317XYG6_9BASI|nr:hypothetical protein BCV70DRAFT_9113 [Testicularia cyperi]